MHHLSHNMITPWLYDGANLKLFCCIATPSWPFNHSRYETLTRMTLLSHWAPWIACYLCSMVLECFSNRWECHSRKPNKFKPRCQVSKILSKKWIFFNVASPGFEPKTMKLAIGHVTNSGNVALYDQSTYYYRYINKQNN